MAIQEPVKRYTAQDIYQLSLQGKHYELLNGELVEMTPAKQSHGAIAAEILRLVANFVREHKLGTVYAAETGFALSNGDVLAPDVSFTLRSRVKPETEGFSTVAPDLAVEVFSPSNTRTEMQEKVDSYFGAGTRLVWIVYPRSRTIYVYTASDKVTILQAGAVLDGGDLLPGFSASVSDIFSVLDEQ
jgi:Uma2 family endonuclease